MSLNALQKQIKCLKDYSQSHKPALQDLAYTLGTRRDCWRHRAFAIVSGDVLSEFPDFHSGHAPAMTPESLPFVFTGQGAHWYGMGKELLLRSESFRADIQELDRVLQALPDPPSWTMEGKLHVLPIFSTHANFTYQRGYPLARIHQLASMPSSRSLCALPFRSESSTYLPRGMFIQRPSSATQVVRWLPLMPLKQSPLKLRSLRHTIVVRP
jgi:hypothetical protein